MCIRLVSVLTILSKKRICTCTQIQRGVLTTTKFKYQIHTCLIFSHNIQDRLHKTLFNHSKSPSYRTTFTSLAGLVPILPLIIHPPIVTFQIAKHRLLPLLLTQQPVANVGSKPLATSVHKVRHVVNVAIQQQTTSFRDRSVRVPWWI